MASPPRLSAHGARRRVRDDARAWAADRRGATAVEFAIIATPFFFMIFAIIELGLYFMVQVTLDNATAVAARQLRTGVTVAQGTSDTTDKQKIVNLVCSSMSWLATQCSSGGATPYLVVDVRPLGTYSNTNPGGPTLNASGPATNTCFYSGSAGAAVEMRAYYRWQLVTSMLSGLQTFAGGVAELKSTEVFQVEPNGQVNPTPTTPNQC